MLECWACWDVRLDSWVGKDPRGFNTRSPARVVGFHAPTHAQCWKADRPGISNRREGAKQGFVHRNSLGKFVGSPSMGAVCARCLIDISQLFNNHNYFFEKVDHVFRASSKPAD